MLSISERDTHIMNILQSRFCVCAKMYQKFSRILSSDEGQTHQIDAQHIAK